MSGSGDKYTDENAVDDFNSGFTNPDKTGPALVKTEGAEGEDGASKVEGAEGADTTAAEGAEGADTTVAEGEDKPEETVTVTKAQLERLLAAADKVDGVEGRVEKLFGTTGDLKSLVKNLQDATPKGMKVEIPADAFKEMEEEYPEIAAHMRKSLEKTLSNVKGTNDDKPAAGTDDKIAGALRPEAIQKIVEDSAVRREMKLLEEEHPNWRKDVGLTDAKGTVDPKSPFRVWLSKRDADYRNRINETDSPLAVAVALDRFKAFSAAQKAKPPVPPNKKDAARNDRIEDAVTQRGDGGQPRNRKTNDEEFAEGFKTG